MQVSLVITVLGPDRKGFVKSLSETINKNHGSWKESRMSHLAGKFAGIMQIAVPEDYLESLSTELNNLQTDSFKITIEKAVKNTNQATTATLSLELMAQDRQGIIHDITKQLEQLNVNIEELDTEVREASMSGGTLFIAKLTLGLPDGVSADEVQDSLESMSDQFMVDLDFS